MPRWIIAALVSALTLISFTCASRECSAQEEVETLSDWFREGSWYAKFRLRHESVEQDNALRNADATTLRTRFGLKSAVWAGVSVHVEGEDVRALADDYNDGSNGISQFSAILDPEGTELNQAYLNVDTGATRFRAGRQRMVFDNARFFGDVGWRQNQQTYDAATIMYRPSGGHRLQYAYMWGVRRFLGEDHPVGELDLRTHALNYSFARLNTDRVSAYAYLLDMRNAPVRARSTQSYGLRYRGSLGEGPTRLLYLLEYANQSGYADGADSNDADYARIDVGLKLANEWSVTAGLENLGGDGVYGFQTQMATLHAFNGYADVFAGGTPPTGLRDTFVKLYAPLGGVRVNLDFHQFDADKGGADYGSEWDVALVGRLSAQLELGVKLADYRAKSFGVDTTKVWAWFAFSLGDQ